MTLSLEAAMLGFQPQLPLGIAFSAGADSTALLAACAQKWPGQVVALHVNHNLQSANAAFEQRCVQMCGALGVELRVMPTDARSKPGQSPEDAARIARYAALQSLAVQASGLGPINALALAHHADDQVETLLIALSRGSGLAGLASMPSQWTRDGLHWHRPLLNVSRAQIREWLSHAHRDFIEDPSNTDVAFTRNRVRSDVMPSIAAAFPAFRDTFTRSAGHCAAAQELLDDLARAELAVTLRAKDNLPQIQMLQKLNANHLSNVLRYWLKDRFGVIPSKAQVNELVSQIYACTNRGKSIEIKVGQGVAVRLGDVLTWYNPRLLQRKY